MFSCPSYVQITYRKTTNCYQTNDFFVNILATYLPMLFDELAAETLVTHNTKDIWWNILIFVQSGECIVTLSFTFTVVDL